MFTLKADSGALWGWLRCQRTGVQAGLRELDVGVHGGAGEVEGQPHGEALRVDGGEAERPFSRAGHAMWGWRKKGRRRSCCATLPAALH